MEHRNLGKSGLQVSLVGLGCNNFGGRLDLEATQTVVHKALDAGITLYDTADMCAPPADLPPPAGRSARRAPLRRSIRNA